MTAHRDIPADLETEAALLGAMLLSKEAVLVATEILNPGSFHRPAHGHIFEAMQALLWKDEPIDVVSVQAVLKTRDLLEAVGGIPALKALRNDAPAASNASRYAKVIAEHATLRNLIVVGGEIAELGYSHPDDVRSVVDLAEQKVFALTSQRKASTLSKVDEVLDDTLRHVLELREAGEELPGLPTGYADIDEMLGGLRPGQLIVIGGRPGDGKTSLAMGAAVHSAVWARMPTLVFSLEMRKRELTQRILSSEARVDGGRLRSGRITDSDLEKLSRAVGPIAEAPLWIDDNPNATVAEMRAKARRLQSDHGQLGLVVVDYLQLIEGAAPVGAYRRQENRATEVASISRGLKLLARELECPVIALSQLNRGDREDMRPTLKSLRESGAIEQDADAVILLHRDPAREGFVEAIIAKQRSGPTGIVELAWLGQYTKFANTARGA